MNTARTKSKANELWIAQNVLNLINKEGRTVGHSPRLSPRQLPLPVHSNHL